MHLPTLSLVAVLALAGSATASNFHGKLTLLWDRNGNGAKEDARLELELEGSSVKYQAQFGGFDKCNLPYTGTSHCHVGFDQSAGGGKDSFPADVWEQDGCWYINFFHHKGWDQGGCCGTSDCVIAA